MWPQSRAVYNARPHGTFCNPVCEPLLCRHKGLLCWHAWVRMSLRKAKPIVHKEVQACVSLIVRRQRSPYKHKRVLRLARLPLGSWCPDLCRETGQQARVQSACP